ncbi:Protein serine/threonine phosphatase PrpC, regulation of stationary phase [Minicystis rosea]|nr:Protein serine/threonine phosphatase PrpC, regulation of stationary phase [Minicystis rosea]
MALFSTSGTTVVSAQHPQIESCRLVSAGGTDRGKRRPNNEDRYGVFPDLGLFVVADGMGGRAAGEVAARITIEETCKALVTAGAIGPQPPLPTLVTAIQHANYQVHDRAQGTPAWRGMGSTVAALLACGHRAALAHVGDSRIYRLRGDRLTLLTEDHSLFNDWVRAGIAIPHRPESFPHRHVITRAVGTAPAVEVDARVVEVVPGDTFLLCSDGLSGVVGVRDMLEILMHTDDLESAVEWLITRANQLGGPDNVTAVAVRWEAGNARSRSNA